MNTSVVLSGVLALLVSGCVAPSPQRASAPLRISAVFDAAAARDAIKDGPHTISGSAFMRQRGGGVVTCAGYEVSLIPVNAYAETRISYLYAERNAGFRPVSADRLAFDPDPPEYQELRRQTKCDQRGEFRFEAVADGEYFVIAVVIWEAGKSAQGGTLFTRVKVQGRSPSPLMLSA